MLYYFFSVRYVDALQFKKEKLNEEKKNNASKKRALKMLQPFRFIFSSSHDYRILQCIYFGSRNISVYTC